LIAIRIVIKDENDDEIIIVAFACQYNRRAVQQWWRSADVTSELYFSEYVFDWVNLSIL
jgi:hypothetical protein